MEEKKVAEALVDVLSDFPDEMLGHILSFLPTALSVRTSILSSRWKHVYKGVPKIESSIENLKCSLRMISDLITLLQGIMGELLVDENEVQEERNALVKSEKLRMAGILLEKLTNVQAHMSGLPHNAREIDVDLCAAIKLGETLAYDDDDDDEQQQQEDEEEEDDDDDHEQQEEEDEEEEDDDDEGKGEGEEGDDDEE